ncbi:MAG: hypothetical protein P1U63_12715 [Coxiellaceae bacterium]|nr:hypothetical protein [Coxiellaceae bacterium]
MRSTRSGITAGMRRTEQLFEKIKRLDRLVQGKINKLPAPFKGEFSETLLEWRVDLANLGASPSMPDLQASFTRLSSLRGNVVSCSQALYRSTPEFEARQAAAWASLFPEDKGMYEDPDVLEQLLDEHGPKA